MHVGHFSESFIKIESSFSLFFPSPLQYLIDVEVLNAVTSVTGTNTYFTATAAAAVIVLLCAHCAFFALILIEMQLNLFVHYTCNSLFISNHAIASCAFFSFSFSLAFSTTYSFFLLQLVPVYCVSI